MRYVVQLTFDTPLHIGKRGVGLEAVEDWVPSDTLFAGIANAWVEAHGVADLESMLAEFQSGRAPFRISSAFPRVGDTWFLPAPRVRPSSLHNDDVVPSGFKDARVTSLELFKLWTGARIPMEDLEKSLARSKEDLESGVRRVVRPRIRVDRAGGATNLFFVGETHFAANSGLWFVAEAEDPWMDKLRAALHRLAVLGLGGERSAGFGRFQWKDGPLTPDVSPIAQLFGNQEPLRGCLISRFFPSEQELRNLRDLHLLGYRLISISGWVGSRASTPGQRQKTCRMFSEGSIFQAFRAVGRLADVTPGGAPSGQHRVYRYGLALAVAAS